MFTTLLLSVATARGDDFEAVATAEPDAVGLGEWVEVTVGYSGDSYECPCQFSLSRLVGDDGELEYTESGFRFKFDRMSVADASCLHVAITGLANDSTGQQAIIAGPIVHLHSDGYALEPNGEGDYHCVPVYEEGNDKPDTTGDTGCQSGGAWVAALPLVVLSRARRRRL